jgi:ATP-binding cassette subfamily C protein CydC
MRSIAARAHLHSALASDLSGLADLTGFGQEGRLGGDLTASSRAMDRERRTLSSIRGAAGGAGSILAGVAGLAVLALAIPEVRGGGIEGVFLASLPLVAFAAYEAVLPLGDASREVELSRAAAARTFEIVDAPLPVPEPDEPLAPPAHPGLELRHVRFRYDDGSPDVLDDVSLALRPCDRLGLTGPSGAGKTTIVGLLLRFWDAVSGDVLLDGLDVRRFRADDVRALIGVVPQQVYLFNGSLRDNLLVADGLDTLVGDDGLKLSGGERQRVAIARAVLKDAPILILDEATANLDAATEAEVVEQIDVFARDKTLLVISHRPVALELADRVMTLGSVREPAREPEALG